MVLRNQYLAAKPKPVKVDRVKQKEQRMDVLMDIVDREKEIKDYQLQIICGWGDGIFYSISKAVLQTYPNSYTREKGVWKVKQEPAKTKLSFPLSTDWDSNEIPKQLRISLIVSVCFNLIILSSVF